MTTNFKIRLTVQSKNKNFFIQGSSNTLTTPTSTSERFFNYPPSADIILIIIMIVVRF